MSQQRCLLVSSDRIALCDLFIPKYWNFLYFSLCVEDQESKGYEDHRHTIRLVSVFVLALKQVRLCNERFLWRQLFSFAFCKYRYKIKDKIILSLPLIGRRMICIVCKKKKKKKLRVDIFCTVYDFHLAGVCILEGNYSSNYQKRGCRHVVAKFLCTS